MKLSRNLLLWAAVAAVLGWWFFMGDNPVQLVRRFVGRGKRLTRTTIDGNDDVVQSVDEVVAQVRAAMGRDVSEDAILLARVSASEHPGAAEREKGAVQWVCRNDAAKHGWSQRYTVTVNRGTNRGKLGHQSGRRYASHLDIYEDDLYIAESLLAGQIPDITFGATKFVHYTGFRRFQDFLAARPKVQAWIDEGGLAPVFLGDVSTFVCFLPESQVSADGQPLAALEGIG